MNTCTLEQARAAKQKARTVLGATDAGVGITRVDAGYGLKVNLQRPPARPLPTSVDGVPLQVEIVGPIRKHRP